MAVTAELLFAKWVNGGTNDGTWDAPVDIQHGDLLIQYVIEAEGSTDLTYSPGGNMYGVYWYSVVHVFTANNCAISMWACRPTTDFTGVYFEVNVPSSRHFRWGAVRLKGAIESYPGYYRKTDVVSDPYTVTDYITTPRILLTAWGDWNHIDASGRTLYPNPVYGTTELDYYRDASWSTSGLHFTPIVENVNLPAGVGGFAGAKVAVASLMIRNNPEAIAPGRVTESDEAGAITAINGIVVLDQPVETDVAQPVGHYRIKRFGQATEADLAQPVALRHTAKIIMLQPGETDLAQAVTPEHRLTLAQVTETDAALGPLTGAHRAVVRQSVEISDANPVTALGTTAVLQAVETDEANSVRPLGPIAVLLGMVGETDLARVMGIGHGPPLPPPPPPATPRYRLVRTNGIDDHPRPNHPLWRRVAFPRTLPMLLLSGDPDSGVPGTVRELLSEGSQYDLEGVVYVIGGTWYGDQGDWIALTLQAAGYTLEQVGG